MTLEVYRLLRDAVINHGHEDDIFWSETNRKIARGEHDRFFSEYCFVVVNSGMKAQVARRIYEKVMPIVTNGGSASVVFHHEGKARAIDDVWKRREAELTRYLAAEDKLACCRSLPWIGDITKYHLAKNLGEDIAKPDRHLVRIAGAEGPHALCARLAKASGDRICTVDVVIWRAANLGLA